MLYTEKINHDFEKMLMAMTAALPYNEIDIKSRPYMEFFALLNRTQEIIQQREKDSQ